MFTIGQFSRISGFTVKTLRFYHEKGILVPRYVDDETSYRYYDAAGVERARVIAQLRAFDFSVAEISEILESCDDESDLVAYLDRQRGVLQQRIRDQRKMLKQLDSIITSEREARIMADSSTSQVEEKTLETVRIAGVRMKGKYCECGKGFGKLGRAVGRFIAGKPMNLYYDCEYKEDDADMEPCFPVKPAAKEKPGISVRDLPGGRCVSLMHLGPYDELGRSYEKLFAYVEEKGYKTLLPSREVYIKGPGMIFRGNPKKYLTEIQVLLEE